MLPDPGICRSNCFSFMIWMNSSRKALIPATRPQRVKKRQKPVVTQPAQQDFDLIHYDEGMEQANQFGLSFRVSERAMG